MQSSSTEHRGNFKGRVWLPPRWFAVLLAALTLAAFTGVLVGGQSFVYRDFGTFSYPIAHYLRESFWRGELPLWNPLSNCGMPFLAEWNTQVLYPPALFYVLLPMPWSLSTFCVLHLVLGGVGMHYLSKQWTDNCFAAAFAGLVFSFNGLVLNSLMWPAFIAGLGWMPWVVWLTERAWREGRKEVLHAAFAGGLQMLSGAVEVILLTWVLLGSLCVLEIVRGELSRMKILSRAIAVVALITCLSAAQLLPFFDLLQHSHREGWGVSTQWPMPKSGWLSFLVPLLHCSLQQGVFVQDNQYWTFSYYVGIATLVLALRALFKGNRRVWLLTALTLICLFLALGEATPIYPWLCRHARLVGLMRFPIKFVILPVFVMPLLAGYSLADQRQEKGESRSKWDWSWGFVWLLVVLVSAGILWWNHTWPHTNDDRTATLKNGVERLMFFTAIVGCILTLGRISLVRAGRALQVGLLVLVWLDLYQHEPQPQTVEKAVYDPRLLCNLPKPQFGLSRGLLPDPVRYRLSSSYFPEAKADFLNRRFGLFFNCNLLDDIPKCDGFFPLYLSDYSNLYSQGFNERMLDFMGISETVTVKSNALAWEPREAFMPLLSGGQTPVFTNEARILSMLCSSNFNPRTEVFLPPEAKEAIRASDHSSFKTLGASFSAQKIEARVEADAVSILVVAQTYYHPWHAYVDDKPTRLWRANYAFQALEIPPGNHRVVLLYRDYLFYFGAAVSITALAGSLGGLWFLKRPRNLAAQ